MQTLAARKKGRIAPPLFLFAPDRHRAIVGLAYGAFEKVAKFSLPTKPNFVTFESVMIFSSLLAT